MSKSDTESLRGVESEALHILPTIPRDENGPVFAEPWQAQVFAMTLALYGRGLFTWIEWAEHLAAAINEAQSAGDPDCGDSYYQHWLNALEKILQSKQIAKGDQLHSLQQAWAVAADSTPHGQAIELSTQQRTALASNSSSNSC